MYLRFASLSSGEIERCLKKVTEGVEQFEDIWKKVRKDYVSTLCTAHYIMLIIIAAENSALRHRKNIYF